MIATAPPKTSRDRRLTGLLGLAILLFLAAVASVAIGTLSLSPGEVWHALVDPTGSVADGIVRESRVPRTVLGISVGIALGMAGALIQGHTRNPLADPGLLGLNAGAAFLVVLSMYYLGLSMPGQYVWFALAGSFLASIVVFGIASIGGGSASPLTLALAGAAVTFCLQALTNAFLLRDVTSLDAYRFWVVGSITGRNIDVFWDVAPFLLLGLILALANTPALNVMNLGDDVARALGSNIALNRAVGLLAITLLAGAATAACGPIAFVGLVVPHVARAITGPDYRWLVPYAGLIGAVLVLVADVIGRVVIMPSELHVGIVLALIGGPFFIAVVRRRKLVAL